MNWKKEFCDQKENLNTENAKTLRQDPNVTREEEREKSSYMQIDLKAFFDNQSKAESLEHQQKVEMFILKHTLLKSAEPNRTR